MEAGENPADRRDEPTETGVKLRYLSVCSGIEAASVAWEPLGFTPAGLSEIETFPCSVLAHRFPNVRNFGDMTRFEEWDINGTVDILVGGTPCQSFSIAGLRGGLEDGRGNLALTYCRILQKFKPRWFVWENVPGVLSSSGGRDFGSILGAMVELGYGIAYRFLDAQYFGVPQRRRRVFVVGCLGDWRSAAQVLFEPGCVSGDSAKGRKKRTAVAALTATGVGTCGADDNQGQAGHLIATPFAQNQLGEVRVGEVFNTINTNSNASGRNTAMVHIATSTGNRSHCLNAGGMGRQDYETETMVVSICEGAHGVTECDIAQTLQSTGGKPGQGYQAIRNSAGVRRLTPRECERLQGFPDDWTLVPHRNKTAADGPRYKAIGNSMAVPVMRWIGERIASAK